MHVLYMRIRTLVPGSAGSVCVYGKGIACIGGVQGSVCTVRTWQLVCRGLRVYGPGCPPGFDGRVDRLGQGYATSGKTQMSTFFAFRKGRVKIGLTTVVRSY